MQLRDKKTKQANGVNIVNTSNSIQLMVYLAMTASAFLFLVMTVVYAMQRMGTSNQLMDLKIPNFFIASTILMLLSSFLITHARIFFETDQLKKSMQYLIGTLVLGISFMILQVLGWVEFYRMGYSIPTSNVASSYVYFISGLHLTHVAIGIGYLFYILFRVVKQTNNVVSELIFTTNPFEKTRMKIISQYWHYVDFLWLALFMVFLITF